MTNRSRQKYVLGEIAERTQMYAYFAPAIDFDGVEMFCDSAEPDRIKTWSKAGFRAYPVKKEPGSVKAQIDWLKGRKIHIHPSCVNVLKEVQQWKWKKDPTSGLYIDEPVEFMDDAMAALRYSVERLRRGSSIEVLK